MPVLKMGVDKEGGAGEGGGMPGDRSSGSTCSLALLFTHVLTPTGYTVVSCSVCDAHASYDLSKHQQNKPDAGLRVVKRSRSASWQFVGESAARNNSTSSLSAA